MSKSKLTLVSLCLVSLVGCEGAGGEGEPGNIVFALTAGELETSRPGEWTSGSGTMNEALLALVHRGNGQALRIHQEGGGVGVEVVAERTDATHPAVLVVGKGAGPAVRITDGALELGAKSMPVHGAPTHVSAGETITLEAPTSLLVIDAMSGAQRNEVTLPALPDGAVLVVANDDDDVVRVGTLEIASGEAASVLMLGGRPRPLR